MKTIKVRFENVQWSRVKEMLGSESKVNSVVDIYRKYHGLLCKQALMELKTTHTKGFIRWYWEEIGNLLMQDIPDVYERLIG